jgi:hypothetical protein
MLEIVLADHLSEPRQAFVIAHVENVDHNDRWGRLQFGLNDWHRINLGETPACVRLGPDWDDLAAVP